MDESESESDSGSENSLCMRVKQASELAGHPVQWRAKRGGQVACRKRGGQVEGRKRGGKSARRK
jgi:hypothetical protein